MNDDRPSPRARRFDTLYRGTIDPWNVRLSDYEHEKYRATLAALPRPRYRRAVEIGCSIGGLTQRLGERADDVLGVDVSIVAIEEARRTLGHDPNLRFKRGEIPRDWPPGTFDLVVLSEVLYFLSPEEIDVLADRVALTLELGGHCVVVCWLGETDQVHDLGGAEAGDRFSAALLESRFAAIVCDERRSFRERRYRLDLFTRVVPRAIDREIPRGIT